MCTNLRRARHQNKMGSGFLGLLILLALLFIVFIVITLRLKKNPANKISPLPQKTSVPSTEPDKAPVPNEVKNAQSGAAPGTPSAPAVPNPLRPPENNQVSPPSADHRVFSSPALPSAAPLSNVPGTPNTTLPSKGGAPQQLVPPVSGSILPPAPVTTNPPPSIESTLHPVPNPPATVPLPTGPPPSPIPGTLPAPTPIPDYTLHPGPGAPPIPTSPPPAPPPTDYTKTPVPAPKPIPVPPPVNR